MAELYGQWQTALDANGDPIPGARLSTYDSVATGTPKTTFSDPDLTTPHTNPVVADAGGKFPQVYADTGESFYLILKTAAGVQVADYERVDALGETGTGAFERDFDAGGRYKLSGALGVVSQEFGPPQGDDTGGDFKLSGRGGTQADTGEIDVAELTITGNLTIEGEIDAPAAVSFPRVLASGSVTASSGVDIPLPANFDRYQIEIFNLSGTGSQVRVQFSFDNGETYKSGVADYLYQGFHQTNSAFVNGSVTSAAYILASTANDETADAGRMFVDVRSQTGHESHVSSAFTVLDSSALNSNSGVYSGFTKNKSFGKATHVRIYPGSGTFTLSYKMMGHP